MPFSLALSDTELKLLSLSENDKAYVDEMYERYQEEFAYHYKEKKNKKQAKIASGMKFTDLAIKALRTELVPAFMGLLGMALGFISLAYCIDLSGKTQFRPYVVTVDKQGSVLF